MKRPVITIYADEVEAGDELILRLKDGSKRAFHICEVYCDKRVVKITFNTRWAYGHRDYKPDDRIRVR